MPSHVGNLYDLLKLQADRSPRSHSFLSGRWTDVDEWKREARAVMHDRLSYFPEEVPLEPEVLEETPQDGYRRLKVAFTSAPGVRVPAYLLLPEPGHFPAPAVVAIHDHGGFYYFGKEKIVAVEDEPGVLREFKESAYGGRSYASELARSGFVVLTIDGFYFGERKIALDSLPEQFTQPLRGLTPGTDEYIRAANSLLGAHEHLVAKTIFTAGVTWPGLLFYDDRKSVDYLLTRPEVDPARIGCLGLSIGGFRAAHLCGLDERIRAAVVVGWMTTYESLLYDHLLHHTWMIYVPGQYRFLDLPDVASLTVPHPLLVLNCARDALFTREGMEAAADRIQRVYDRLGARDRFRMSFYDVPHQFNAEMQYEAFEWLGRWLGR